MSADERRLSVPESIVMTPVAQKRASRISNFDFFQPAQLAVHPEETYDDDDAASFAASFDFFQPTPAREVRTREVMRTREVLQIEKRKDENSDYYTERDSKTPDAEIGISVIEVPTKVVVVAPPFPEGGFWGWMTLFGA